MSHYFINDKNLASKERLISYSIGGVDISLLTDSGVFSKNGIDRGTMVILKTISPLINAGTVLDIGCGYGALGLTLASLTQLSELTCSDVNIRALTLCEKNAQRLGLSKRVTVLRSDLYENIEGSFDYIVSNPPIRAGKEVTYGIYDGAYTHLNSGGILFIVIRRAQGAESAMKHIKEIFGNVEVINRDSGYWILKATKVS